MQLDTLAPIRDRVFWQGKTTVIYWGIFTAVRNIEPWVIAPDVMSESGYVRRHILNNGRFHLWDCPTDL